MPSPMRHFLQKKPWPHTVRGYDAAGEKRTCKINFGSKSKWVEAEKVLDGCVRLEALSDKQEITRVVEFDVMEPDAPAEEVHPLASKSEAIAIVSVVAKLLVDAADRSAARHEAAYAIGMEQLSRVVQLTTDRLTQLERALQRWVLSVDPKKAEDPQFSADSLLAMVLARSMPTTVVQQPPNGAAAHEQEDGG